MLKEVDHEGLLLKSYRKLCQEEKKFGTGLKGRRPKSDSQRGMDCVSKKGKKKDIRRGTWATCLPGL